MKDCHQIKIWRFEDAPQSLRELSGMGGDEDWIAVIPEHIYNEEAIRTEKGCPWWTWLLNMDAMQEPEVHRLDGGDYAFIGGH